MPRQSKRQKVTSDIPVGELEESTKTMSLIPPLASLLKDGIPDELAVSKSAEEIPSLRFLEEIRDEVEDIFALLLIFYAKAKKFRIFRHLQRT